MVGIDKFGIFKNSILFSDVVRGRVVNSENGCYGDQPYPNVVRM